MKQTGREKFSKYKRIITFSVKVVKVLPKGIRVWLWESTSRYNGLLAVFLRYIILKSLIFNCGENIKIGSNVRILHWKGLSVGDNVSIHSNCYIDACGEIIIGDNVSMAHNSTILSSNHSWEDSSIPIKYNPIIKSKVVINNDVWIGCGVRILAGVDIGQRVILAAGTIVTKNVEKNVIIGGVPGKVIKKI